MKKQKKCLDSPADSNASFQRTGFRGLARWWHRISSPTLHARKINPGEQDRDFRGIQFHMLSAWLGHRSLKGPDLQTFVNNEKAIAIPSHQFDPIEPSIEKQEQVSLANVFLKLGLNNPQKTIEALSHVDVLRIKINSRWWLE
jgi:hypothetical protein